MSIFHTLWLFGLIPLAAVLIVGAVSMRAKPATGSTTPVYRLGDAWTHKPMLWTATDEMVSQPGHSSHGGSAHGESALDVIGGSASGKW